MHNRKYSTSLVIKEWNYRDISLHIQKKDKNHGIQSSWQIDGETVADFIFLGSKSLQTVTAAMKLKDSCSLEEKL